MKLVLLFILSFLFFLSYSQEEEKEFYIEAQIIDENSNPLSDVYILNYRNLDKTVSNTNGIFNMWVLPGDSLMISHVSYHRQIIRVFDLMVNPIIQIDLDTVNIMEINIFSNPQNEIENAKKNMESIQFSIKPSITEGFTEKEMVQDMLNRENGIMKSEATSLKIVSFSPTMVVGIIADKIKRRKKANQFSSRKKKSKKNYSGASE